MSALTIVLPLKGRPLHTLRFLVHAERARLPYRFLIADGQVEPALAAVLDNPRSFPNLAIDYVRYPDDRSYSDYFRKMADASARVRTPYAMHADNDDFLLRSGIDRCMAFLETHDDYVCCGGGVGGFSLHPAGGAMANVTGTIQSLGAQYHDGYIDEDYGAPSAATRIHQRFGAGYTLFYHVVRTPALAAISRECAEIGFSDLRVHETFFGARAKALGKARLDRGVMSYLRQRGTSQAETMWRNTASAPPAAEIALFTEIVARAAAQADGGIDAKAFADELRLLYTGIWQAELDERRGRSRVPARASLREALSPIVPARIVALRRAFLRSRARQSIAAVLRRHGASEHMLAEFVRELADIEALLEGPDVAAFIQRHAPGLRDAGRVA